MSAEPRSKLPVRWRYSGIAALLAITLIATTLCFRKATPLLEVPTPSNLNKLEPQLRDYVEEKVKWVRTAPRDPQRQATLGLVYAANSLWPEARLAFQNAVRLNPKEPLAHLYVAVSTQESGNVDEALSLYRELTIQFPNFAPGFYRLGEALLRAGAVAEAETAFRQLIILAPQEWRGYVGLGDVNIRRNEHAEAIKNLKKALQLDPNTKRAHHLLGLAYRGSGQLEDAQRELSLGLDAVNYPMPDAWSKEAPQHMKLLQDQFQMANEYSELGHPERAIEILVKAFTYHTNNLGVMNHLGIAYNRAGQFEKARALLLRIIQIDDRHLPARIALSYSCTGLGLNEEALKHAERAIELVPDVAQAHLAKANVLLAMERDAEALSALESALRCDPKNAQIRMEIGDVCWRNLDQPNKALEHYREATKLDPTLVPAFAKLAEVSIRLGQTPEARNAIESLRKLAPTEPALAVLERALRKITTQ
jgi:tetratricopeptide (TPR) repeat protein